MIVSNMEKRIPIAKMLSFGILPSPLKKLIYRLQGNHIGHNVHLSIGSVIDCRSKFSIGDDSKLGFFTSIVADQFDMGKRSNIRSVALINAYKVKIGNDVTISETAIIRAGHKSQYSELIVDDLVHIFPSTTIDPSRCVHLKQECAVGPQCSIFTHGSYKNILEGYPVTYGNVEIGERVELTYNVFVAPGVIIGDDVIIAYGSYVNKNIPAGVLAGGCPAQIKREKDDFIKVPSFDEKVGLMRHILNEFSEYQLSVGFIENYSNEIDCWRFQKKKHCYELKLDTSRSQNFQLILKDSREHTCIKFNLYDYLCDAPSSDMAQQLRRFLSRYGVRFIVKE